MSKIFKRKFDDYALEGDTLTATRDGFDLVARIVHDDDPTPPDKRQDGFWPSLDPDDPGYIGPKSRATYFRALKRARSVLEDWKRDRWSYCGIVVTASREGVELGHAALWGLELNYPSKSKHPNAYLDHIANELAPEALADARATVGRISRPIQQQEQTTHGTL